jgi:hypothetical protein
MTAGDGQIRGGYPRLGPGVNGTFGENRLNLGAKGRLAIRIIRHVLIVCLQKRSYEERAYCIALLAFPVTRLRSKGAQDE